MRYKSLGVLVTASLLTLGACADEGGTPTVAPLVSPVAEEPTELPGLIPGDTPAPDDEVQEEPLPEDAG